MSEETFKRQRRDLAESVFERFKPFGYKKEIMSGEPFDIRIFRPGCKEWLFRCIPTVTKKDQDLVRDDIRPEYCIKGIVFRVAPGSRSNKICFLEIE